MLNCKMGRHQILGLLFFLFFLHSSPPFASSLCPPDQRDALLLFKNSSVLESKVSICRYASSYPRTESWNESVDCCSWEGVSCDYDTSNVVELNLPCSRLRGPLHSISSLLLIPHLKYLNLFGNDFAGSSILPNLSAFPKATHQNLSHSSFSLEVLLLPHCNLTKFPYFLNSLKRLTLLDLSFNMISGEIPRWFWKISHETLENLELSHNLLEGGIQQLHWKQLRYINLQSNSFQGPLPIPPPSTFCFIASDNGFTGEIPSSICQLSSLWDLDLSRNNLFGNMPQCFGNITSLNYLDLSSNKLQGSLPHSLVKCRNLLSLSLSHNEFNDIFPYWLDALQLYTLDLQFNKFHSRINLTSFGLSFPNLDVLYISNNDFTGLLPMEGFSNTSLSVINLSNNKFEGPIPFPSPVTFYYSIANNEISGKIPSLICNATKIEIIDLSNNSLIGSLPQCLINSSVVMSVLNLRMNHLEGIIPKSFSSTQWLTTLDLSQNRFEGTLPRSLVECKNLEVLDLSSNQIEDSFPGWLGTLPNLKVLVLRSNNFKGLLNIMKEALLFPKLRILDLSKNNFGGPLPANLIMNLEGMMNRENVQDGSLYMTQASQMESYENSVIVAMKGIEVELVKILTIFTTIDLSHNSFQGEILEVFGNLHSLIGLNLSHNHLTGPIPSTLGNLANLGWLDLSSNKLSGGIPKVLGDLASLGYLDLSNNKFIGRVPQDKQLSTFSNDSFSGNPGLCGTPLSKACPDDAPTPPPPSSSTFDHEGSKSWLKQKVVWIGYASGIVIGTSIAHIACETGRPKWLMQGVRMLERRAAKWMKKTKRKAIKFHGQ